MNIELAKSDNQLKRDFLAMKTLEDVANVLGVKKSLIIYYLYQKNNRKLNYRKFYIKKKNGQDREILSPVDGLKIIQRKLNYIFLLIYNPLDCVFGFSPERNIKKNAINHIGKTILNLDLKDFFPTIHFGRVRGLFLVKPFSFNKEVATVLAQICCYEGSLPQGSPTSPIISNMICYSLDKDLMKFSQERDLFYTRYADDITISSFKKYLDRDLVYFAEGVLLCGEKLKYIIEEKNSFKINLNKFNLVTRSSIRRKQVTGLVVNKKVNVKRSFIRGIRAMLHAWEKFGFEEAQKEHFIKYKTKSKFFYSSNYFKEMVLGKILFVKHIKGEANPVFRRLINKYFDLIGEPEAKLLVEENDQILDSVCIVETKEKNGTGFFISNDKIVTCRHVLVDEEGSILKDNISIFKEEDANKKYNVELLGDDAHLDIALLKVKNFKNKTYFSVKADLLKNSDTICFAGYPNYSFGDSWHRLDKIEILSVKKRNGLSFYDINTRDIYEGMSGGPVFQGKYLVGIVVGREQSMADPKYNPKMILAAQHLKSFTNKLWIPGFLRN